MPWADMNPAIFYPFSVAGIALMFAVGAGVADWFERRRR